MQNSLDEAVDVRRVQKMQKQRAREMVKYVAENITPNIDNAFNVTQNSVTYKLLMDTETGIWKRPVKDSVDMLAKELDKDLDSWVDVMIQSDKCRSLMACI